MSLAFQVSHVIECKSSSCSRPNFHLFFFSGKPKFPSSTPLNHFVPVSLRAHANDPHTSWPEFMTTKTLHLWRNYFSSMSQLIQWRARWVTILACSSRLRATPSLVTPLNQDKLYLRFMPLSLCFKPDLESWTLLLINTSWNIRFSSVCDNV